MNVKAFGWQPCLDPIRFALCVVPNMGVAHFRQNTGGILGGVSGWAGAVNHDFDVLLRKQPGCEFLNLIRRQVYGCWQMCVFVCRTWKRLNENEILATVQLGLEFLARDCIYASKHLIF